MDKPTREQIKEWIFKGALLNNDPFPHPEWSDGTVSKALEFAYAAGRNAGIVDARWECARLALKNAGSQRGRGAQDCADVLEHMILEPANG